jgi:hypothetical protein
MFKPILHKYEVRGNYLKKKIIDGTERKKKTTCRRRLYSFAQPFYVLREKFKLFSNDSVLFIGISNQEKCVHSEKIFDTLPTFFI